MKSSGTSWFRIPAVFIAAICLIPIQVKADWTFDYHYEDNFSTQATEEDCYVHSIFWPQGAFPPSEEAYLYFSDSGGREELGFGDYNDEPALLGYCFPIDSERIMGALHGQMQVEVRFPDSTAGYLQYQLSSDGISWSVAEQLRSGKNNIPLESIRGTCYVRFWGTKVLIDNLDVYLKSYSADIKVPGNYSTIQQAINASNNGDIIEVAPGTYSGDIDFQGKAITLRSESGPESTIIDCSNTGHRAFYFHRGEGNDSILRGFTIKNAVIPGSEIPSNNSSWNPSSSHPIGAGIYCEFSSPTIIDCIIKDCSTELGGGVGSVGGEPVIIDCEIKNCRAGGQGPAESGGYGAGIALIRNSQATVINSKIKNNVGYYNGQGAGIYCRQSAAWFTNCDISYNYAQGNIEGGGLYCGDSSTDLLLERCVISHNTASSGGGIFAASGNLTVTNCTIANNELSGASASIGGGIHSQDSNIVISNSIAWFNDGAAIWRNSGSNVNVLYSNIEGGFAGQDNINENPMFASAASGDYHLQSVLGRYNPNWGDWDTDNNHSPCIDTGDPQDPVGSEPFPNNKRINMGAYGGTEEASKSSGPLIFHVDDSHGSDSNSGLSKNEAFRTISRALEGDDVINDDIVMVWPGTYREEIVFNRKRITLQSADDAAVIEAPSNGIAFSFYGAESSNSILRNFVITNCGEAAVLCSSASPELINLTITNNQFGIAAYEGASPVITNCILWNNTNGDIFGDLFEPRAYYSCLGGLGAGDVDRGNISENPLFANPGNGDYHLQSRYGRYVQQSDSWVTDSQTSPCINKGDPGMHRGREPDGGRVNMGAYGGTPYASLGGSPLWSDDNEESLSEITNQ
ncbi:MAG: right-handed parallel beta-helix repeat-containing protein [Sedimentisphaerales bacterium]|nr:right-handed parallel beta-helix repeat-containing protein [Sedimentisphaerales bacterium]